MTIEKSKFAKKLLFSAVLALSLQLAAAGAAWARTVYAGGQSIGVLLSAAGLTVAGVSPVTAEDGRSCSPAEEAGLRSGDLIIRVDGQPTRDSARLQELVDLAGSEGRECSVDYLRQGQSCQTGVTPVYCPDSGRWRLGLSLRQDAAGVGTLTFWDPESGAFGALGHNVTGTDIEGENGLVVRAVIQGLRAGTPGQPGEKLGVLQEEGWQGRISANEVCGVFGHFDSLPAPGGPLLETAGADEVTEGAAEMLTVLDGETVESFAVNIVRAGSEPGRGGMVIEVTDERLLAAAGGIIQGMSGSPLLQNGRLIGAVSHVFINDPCLGCGVYIDDMLEAADSLPSLENAA